MNLWTDLKKQNSILKLKFSLDNLKIGVIFKVLIIINNLSNYILKLSNRKNFNINNFLMNLWIKIYLLNSFFMLNNFDTIKLIL